MRTMRRFLFVLLLGAAATLTLESASAAYPDKPVRVDRAVRARWRHRRGRAQPGDAAGADLEPAGRRRERPGAGGNIGADIVAKAPADGYTVLLASPAEIVINPHLYAHMPYDPAKDLAPVTKIAAAPLRAGGQSVGAGDAAWPSSSPGSRARRTASATRRRALAGRSTSPPSSSA